MSNYLKLVKIAERLAKELRNEKMSSALGKLIIHETECEPKRLSELKKGVSTEYGFIQNNSEIYNPETEDVFEILNQCIVSDYYMTTSTLELSDEEIKATINKFKNTAFLINQASKQYVNAEVFSPWNEFVTAAHLFNQTNMSAFNESQLMKTLQENQTLKTQLSDARSVLAMTKHSVINNTSANGEQNKENNVVLSLRLTQPT